MLKLFLLATAIQLPASLFAQSDDLYLELEEITEPWLPQTKEEFCEAAKDPIYFIQKLKFSKASRMAFKNPRRKVFGMRESGYLCWWHSRFQLNSNYLSFVRPLREGEEPASEEEVSQWIDALMNVKSVVEIRGYASFNEFTEAHKDQIIKAMEEKRFHEFDAGSYRMTSVLGGIIFPKFRVRDDLELAEQMLQEGSGVPFFIGFMNKPYVDHGLLITGVYHDENGKTSVEIIESGEPEKTLFAPFNSKTVRIETEKYHELKPVMHFKYENPRRFQKIVDYCLGSDSVELNKQDYFEEYKELIRQYAG